MPYNFSDTCKKLICLLQNAKELSVDHSNRTLALDTISSCITLANSRKFGEEGLTDVLDVLESLIYAIRSYKPEVLLEEFHKVEEFVLITDIGKTKQQKPKTPELPYADTKMPSEDFSP